VIYKFRGEGGTLHPHWEGASMNTTEPAITSLTCAEFHTAVHALAPRIAVFDCDGTLWSGDAGSTFMRWTMDPARDILSPAAIDHIGQRYQGYLAGQVSELAICGEMVQIYAGIAESTLRTAAAEFFAAHVEPNIFPEMLTLVNELQSAGVEIWAVSSTCNWVIEEGVRRFAIPASRVLAATVEIDATGLATDRLIAVPTDELKVAALDRAGVTTPDAVFGNSIHDAAMLAIARGAFPVNPNPALQTRAATEQWPVFYPASVRPATCS
jgi:phosphoserine phosphatase